MTALNLGPVRQLGYVVQNLESAVEAWQAQLGVGPWTLMRDIPMRCEFRGEASEPLIDIALSYRDDVQIELIQQRNAAPSPYLDFVRQQRFGQHHIAFLCEDIDADVQRCLATGLTLAADIRMPGPGAGRYVYFDSPIPGETTYIELLEATVVMKGLFAKGIMDCREWNGDSRTVNLNLGPTLRLMRGLERLLGRRIL